MQKYKVSFTQEIEAVDEYDLEKKILDRFKVEKISDDVTVPVVNCGFKPFNQRDERWGHVHIGETPYTIAEIGCTITGIASQANWGCANVTPQMLAENLRFTSNGAILWASIDDYEDLKMKFIWRGYGYDKSKILEILTSDDRVTCVEVPFAPAKHWMPVVNYSEEKDDFKVYDPYKEKYLYAKEVYGKITGWCEIKCLKR